METFLSHECAAEQQGGNNELATKEDSSHMYFSFAVVEVPYGIPGISPADGKKLVVKVLYIAMSRILSTIEEI